MGNTVAAWLVFKNFAWNKARLISVNPYDYSAKLARPAQIRFALGRAQDAQKTKESPALVLPSPPSRPSRAIVLGCASAALGSFRSGTMSSWPLSLLATVVVGQIFNCSGKGECSSAIGLRAAVLFLSSRVPNSPLVPWCHGGFGGQSSSDNKRLTAASRMNHLGVGQCLHGPCFCWLPSSLARSSIAAGRGNVLQRSAWEQPSCS